MNVFMAASYSKQNNFSVFFEYQWTMDDDIGSSSKIKKEASD